MPPISRTNIARPICGRTWPPHGPTRSPAGSAMPAAGQPWRPARVCGCWPRPAVRLCFSPMPTIDERLALAIEELRESPPDAAPAEETLDGQLEQLIGQSLAGFARSLAGSEATTELGSLAVNPWSFARRATTPADAVSGLAAAPVGSASEGQPVAIPRSCVGLVYGEPVCALGPLCSGPLSADVPAMGFAWAPAGAGPAAAAAGPARRGWLRGRKAKAPPPLAEECLLRNEFCEIQFDRQSARSPRCVITRTAIPASRSKSRCGWPAPATRMPRAATRSWRPTRLP